MLHNFWYWLILGLTNLIVALAERLPFHNTWGWADYTYGFLAGMLTPILIYIGSYFSLCFFAISMGILVVLELARLIMAAYRTVVKLLPVP